MLLQEATNTNAYAKLGILGFPGSGKTFTSTEIAIGIGNLISNKTVAYFDTEAGSDFLITKLQQSGFKAFQVKSRSFSDLIATIKEAEESKVGVLIIDSITHVWNELRESYEKKLNRKRLQFQDWAIVKGEWKQYTDLYLNSKLHIIVCGRAGYEYDFDVNEDGSKDLIKSGIRMKVESEFAFEPSLVIEMERLDPEAKNFKAMTKEQKQQYRPAYGSKWIHRAYVLKDRTDTINGQQFDNPSFEDFKHFFNKLNLGGKHMAVDTSRTSEDRFEEDTRPDWKQREHDRTVRIEEIKAEFDKHFPSATSPKEKRARIRLAEFIFNKASWEYIEGLSLQDLSDGLAKIKAVCAVPTNNDFFMADAFDKANIVAKKDGMNG